MIKNLFAKVNIALFIIFLVIFGIVLFAPAEPLKINSVDIIGNNFKAGGEMSFKIDRCKYISENVQGTASRYFVNTEDSTKPDIFISSTDDLGEKGCATVTRTFDIPAHIKDGVYKLKFVTRYYPSVLREPTKTEYVAPEPFTIKGQELSAQLNSILEQLEVINGKVGTSNSSSSVSNSRQVAPSPTVTPPTTNTPITEQPPASPEQGNSLIESTINTVNGILKLLI